MAYLESTITGDGLVKKATMSYPFGPGFSEAEAKEAVRMEVHCSSFDDPGEDWTEWKLFNAAGEEFANARYGGY